MHGFVLQPCKLFNKKKKKTNQRDEARQQKLRRKAAVMGELKRKY